MPVSITEVEQVIVLDNIFSAPTSVKVSSVESSSIRDYELVGLSEGADIGNGAWALTTPVTWSSNENEVVFGLTNAHAGGHLNVVEITTAEGTWTFGSLYG